MGDDNYGDSDWDNNDHTDNIHYAVNEAWEYGRNNTGLLAALRSAM